MNAGQTIREYVLVKKLGVGSFGEVWLAEHSLLSKKVAIKIACKQFDDPKLRERFLREARVMSDLDHENIVKVQDVFSINDIIHLVMSYINEDGETLQKWIQKRASRLPINKVLSVSKEILAALDFAHQKGFIHRDIKPSNILMSSSGHAYLADFGIVLMVKEERLTGTGTIAGTVEYMSPEQIANPKKIDHRTDVYSFGCVLYEMLTGQPPFGCRDGGDTEFNIMERHTHHTLKSPLSLRQLNPEVDKNLETVVMRALEKEPDDRFDGCAEMIEALFDKPAAEPTAAAYPVENKILPKPYKSHWKQAGAIVVLSALSLLLLFVALQKQETQNALRPPAAGAIKTEKPEAKQPPPVTKSDTPAPSPSVTEKPDKRDTPPMVKNDQTPLPSKSEALPRFAFLSVVTVPKGTQVFVNGKFKGKTPLTVKLNLGEYEIRLSHPGYRDIENQINLEKMTDYSFKRAMTPIN